MAAPEIYVPDPQKRPSQVVWALRCWLASGALVGLVGFVCIGIGAFGSDQGAGIAFGVGVILVGVGAGYVVMGRNAYHGDVRWRSALAVLTLVVVGMLLFVSFGSPVIALALLFAIVGLFGSLLAYRSESEEWFTGRKPESKKAGQQKSAAPKRKPKR